MFVWRPPCTRVRAPALPPSERAATAAAIVAGARVIMPRTRTRVDRLVRAVVEYPAGNRTVAQASRNGPISSRITPRRRLCQTTSVGGAACRRAACPPLHRTGRRAEAGEASLRVLLALVLPGPAGRGQSATRRS